MPKSGGKHRGNTDNLRPPWKPGESGNPAGRPKGKSITDELRKLVEDGKNGHDVAKALAEVATKYAAKGDFRFWNAIVDRLEGPVKQRHEHTGEGGGNVIIRVVDDRDPDAGD